MVLTTLPNGTTFFFDVCYIEPDYEKVPPEEDADGNWIPPTRWDGYAPGAEIADYIWRWKDGQITRKRNSTSLHSDHRSNENIYRASTIFLRNQSTFLAYPKDVRRFSVRDDRVLNGWQEVGINRSEAMDYEPRPRDGEPRFYYNSVEFPGDYETFRAHINSSWKQLFTSNYNPSEQTSGHDRNAGLIGDLSLIIGLIALSCKTNKFSEVIQQNVRLGRWIAHRHYERPQDRGVVVAIYLDQNSPKTNKRLLSEFEHGIYGPIFGP